MLRCSEAVAVVSGLFELVFAEQQAGLGWAPLRRQVVTENYWLVTAPFLVFVALVIAGIVMLVALQPDPLERVRLRAMGWALPFLVVGIAAPGQPAFLSFGVAELILFAGAVRYYYLQGRRGQFLAGFISPQLIRVVRARG